MFKCAACETSIGPRIKPIFETVLQRDKNYHNEYHVEDEFGVRTKREVDSFGREIVREIKLCEADAVQYFNHPVVERVVLTAKPKLKFQEIIVPTFTTPLVGLAVEAVKRRLDHQTKRAHADCVVVIQGVKEFIDRNKKFVI